MVFQRDLNGASEGVEWRSGSKEFYAERIAMEMAHDEK